MVAIPDSDFQMFFRVIHGTPGKDATVDILYFSDENRWDVSRVQVKEADEEFWNMTV